MTAFWIRLSAAVMFAGVAAGAFGAHALRARVDEKLLEIWKTAVLYQLVHGLALLAVAWLVSRHADPRIRAAGWCFAVGVVVFSGSLYALVLSGQRWLGAVTPLGGLAFLAGWALLVLASYEG